MADTAVAAPAAVAVEDGNHGVEAESGRVDVKKELRTLVQPQRVLLGGLAADSRVAATAASVEQAHARTDEAAAVVAAVLDEATGSFAPAGCSSGGGRKRGGDGW